MKYIKLTEAVESHFEVEVADVLLNFRSLLDREEEEQLLTIRRYWSGSRLYIPEPRVERLALHDVILQWANELEEQVRLDTGMGRDERSFYGRVSRSLSTIAYKLGMAQ